MRTFAFICFITWATVAGAKDIGPAPFSEGGNASALIAGKRFSLDSEGILVFDYGHKYGDLGKWRNPFFISNFANFAYQDYLKSGKTDEIAKSRFLTQAEYLLKSAVLSNDTARWEYPFPQARYGLSKGWISGIGQSRIAGVLRRAHAMTGRSEFIDMADKAMNVYLLPLTEGGVVTEVGNTTWIEEAPNPAGHSFKVLNGHITGLTGVADYYKITGDEKWKALFDRGVEAVRRDIPSFGLMHSSVYSLGFETEPYQPRRKNYHKLHTKQLLWLADETGDQLFTEWASRFVFSLIDPLNSDDVPRYAPITNICNLEGGKKHVYAHLGPFAATPFQVKCKGWLVFQRGTASGLRIAATGSSPITVSASDRFTDWHDIGSVQPSAADDTIDIPRERFVRLSFDATVQSIDNVSPVKGKFVTGLDATLFGNVWKFFSILRN